MEETRQSVDCLDGDPSGICVPADDGGVTQELALLKDKLATFAQAVRDIESQLANRLAAGRDESADTVLSDVAEPASDAYEQVDVSAADGDATAFTSLEDAEPLEENEMVESESPEIEPSEPDDASCEAEESASDIPVEQEMGLEQGALEASEQAQMVDVVDPEAEAMEAATARAIEEDNELLATLDEETVAAIRVMRRLSPTRKSVRELLDEYKARQSKPTTAAPASKKKKSWFRR